MERCLEDISKLIKFVFVKSPSANLTSKILPIRDLERMLDQAPLFSNHSYKLCGV